jgi:hypothetical protein
MRAMPYYQVTWRKKIWKGDEKKGENVKGGRKKKYKGNIEVKW